jgi:PAS domain S-box-containing protein
MKLYLIVEDNNYFDIFDKSFENNSDFKSLLFKDINDFSLFKDIPSGEIIIIDCRILLNDTEFLNYFKNNNLSFVIIPGFEYLITKIIELGFNNYTSFESLKTNLISDKISISELNAVNQRIRQIIDSDANSIIITSNEDYFIDWNQTTINTFNYELHELLNYKFYELIIPDYYRESFIQNYMDWKNSEVSDLTLKTEYYANNKTGYIFPVEMNFTKISDKDDTFYVCFIKDISEKIKSQGEIDRLFEELLLSKDIIEQNASELVELNADLYESEQKLQELNSNKDKFFSIISHDLIGPFQNLIAFSDILNKDFKNLDDDDRIDIIQSIKESSDQLYKLLTNLLQWSRIQLGKISFNPEIFNLYDLVKRNFDLYNGIANKKQITLINNVPENFSIYFDFNIINTVIRNLINNAVKFTSINGEIKIESEISINQVFIKVSDNGVGIDEMSLLKLFRIDVQHTTTGTSDEKGTGLGLILCKELLTMNGGNLKVESKVGKGSTFIILVPLQS